MAKKIIIVGKEAKRVEVIGRPMRRIEPEESAAALGAEPCGERLGPSADLLTLAALGSQLIQRLRSSGDRPSSDDTTERGKVP
jgi:hypothetical protein